MPTRKPQGNTVVDLGKFRGDPSIRVLAGRDIGQDVRSRARIAELDGIAEPVTVLVPSDLFAVTSSFFLGMFADSIRRLGSEGFRSHYLFAGKRIDMVVDDAVRSVGLTEPLG